MLLFLVICSEKSTMVSSPSQGLTSMLLSFHSMLISAPYVQYIRFQLCFEFGNLIRKEAEGDFIKYFLRMENSALFHNVVKITTYVGTIGGLIVTPVLAKFTPVSVCRGVSTFMAIMNGNGFRYSRKELLVGGYLYASLILNMTCHLPYQANAPRLLAQAIDYDELRCGDRRSALFTLLDSLVETVFGIFSSVVPPLILNFLGYKNNGGCECGCGVSCGYGFPPRRWSCPGDVGYACSASFKAPPFYGPKRRPAPCTYQNPMVMRAFSLLFWLAPLCFYGMAAVAVHFFPITKTVHEEILFNKDRSACRLPAWDPVANERVMITRKQPLAEQAGLLPDERNLSVSGFWRRIIGHLSLALTAFLVSGILLYAISNSSMSMAVKPAAITLFLFPLFLSLAASLVLLKRASELAHTSMQLSYALNRLNFDTLQSQHDDSICVSCSGNRVRNAGFAKQWVKAWRSKKLKKVGRAGTEKRRSV